MRTADWLVLCSAVAFVVAWSIRKSYHHRRQQQDNQQRDGAASTAESGLRDFVQSGHDAKWYTIALSVMATQASAVTFISTPGQAYTDGMRFVQFYFGLPLAMVILCIVILPIYRRLNVFTAYEYLERRFDLKTRSLTAFLFLTQRSLAAGLTIYAPSIVLSYVLGWNVSVTIVAIGALVVLYTSIGGTKAVSWAQSYQMGIIFIGMATAFVVILASLPVSVGDALRVAGVGGKLNTLDFSFDLNNRYTVWSGLIGGLFLQLSYFGTDQSQVQRYLTGQSLAQSRLGLIFNGLMKIPMQFAILLLGVMVFVFYQFTPPPMFFNTAEVRSIAGTPAELRYNTLERSYQQQAAARAATVHKYVAARAANNATETARLQTELNRSKQEMAVLRSEALTLLPTHGSAKPNDTNYVFLSFVLTHLPVGLVGLVIAAIVSAAMSSASSEINALASTVVIDVYKRLVKRDTADTDGGNDKQYAQHDSHYVLATRIATVAWGVVIVLFAQYADRLGSLIEAVNIIGSLFYGTILGIFLTAFFLRRVGGTAVFIAALLAEAVVVWLFNTTQISFLWHNLIGCVLVVMMAYGLELVLRGVRTSRKA
jgi:Na+/proline symporter